LATMAPLTASKFRNTAGPAGRDGQAVEVVEPAEVLCMLVEDPVVVAVVVVVVAAVVVVGGSQR
jgi:hypothetical protein